MAPAGAEGRLLVVLVGAAVAAQIVASWPPVAQADALAAVVARSLAALG